MSGDDGSMFNIKSKMKKLFVIIILFSLAVKGGEVNSWECNKYDGAKIIGEDGEYLGELGPSWKTDSIYNTSSQYSSTWSSSSIFNNN